MFITQSSYPKIKQRPYDQLKKAQQQVRILKNRILMLEKHQAEQLKNLEKNQYKINEIIQRKLMINSQQEKKENNQSVIALQIMNKRKKNLQQKLKHETQMHTIMKAIQMVKQSDAKQIRSASQSHLQKIKHFKQQHSIQMKHRQKSIQLQQSMSKVNYVKKIKEKIIKQIQQRKIQIQSIKMKKNSKLKEIQKLALHQQQIMESIHQIHSKSTEQVKHYYAALKLSPQRVAQSFDYKNNEISLKSAIPRIKTHLHDLIRNKSQITTKKLPNTLLNQEKLRLAIQALQNKRKQKQKTKALKQEQIYGQ